MCFFICSSLEEARVAGSFSSSYLMRLVILLFDLILFNNISPTALSHTWRIKLFHVAHHMSPLSDSFQLLGCCCPYFIEINILFHISHCFSVKHSKWLQSLPFVYTFLWIRQISAVQMFLLFSAASLWVQHKLCYTPNKYPGHDLQTQRNSGGMWKSCGKRYTSRFANICNWAMQWVGNNG